MENLPENAKIYYPPEGTDVIGMIQIVHGMAEHQQRYKPLADFLSANGIIVFTSDLRGHGDNIRRPEELGYFGDNGAAHLVEDVHEITMYAKSNFPKLPYFILGHSMGTLITTCYFRKYDNFLDGLFLSGMPGLNPNIGFAKLLIKFLAALKGEFHHSKFFDKLMNGPFAKPFIHEGSSFAWISNNPETVKKYERDPKCGFIFTLNGFFTLMTLMEGAYKSNSWIKKNPDCPILLMSGADDPCMIDRKTFMKSVAMFKNAGYTNVRYILYPGQRHEIFNDKERDKVMKDLLNALKNAIYKYDEDPLLDE